MADDRRQIAEEIADALGHDSWCHWDMDCCGCTCFDSYSERGQQIKRLLPLIDRVKAEAAAEALGLAAVDAFDFGRREARTVSAWLRDRAAALRTTHTATDAQEASTDGR